MQATYDGLGRCVRRVVNGNATLFTYDGWNPIAEWDQAGNFRAWNAYGARPDEILVRCDWNGTLIYKLDEQGNVAFILNGSNQIVEKYSYDAFGAPKISDAAGNPRTYPDGSPKSNIGNRFMYTGREYISELGIYDYRHRFYHPGIGRFIETDPTGFDAGDMNLFRYCGDDPVNKSDPMGLYWLPMTTEEKKQYQAAKDHVAKSDPAKQLFKRIENSRTGFKLSLNKTHDDSYDPKTRTVNWDPKSALKTADGGKQSPALGLVHEIDHALTNRILSGIRGMIPAGK